MLPRTCDLILFGNRVFADVTNIRLSHTGLKWILNLMIDVFKKRRHGTQRHRKESQVQMKTKIGFMLSQTKFL